MKQYKKDNQEHISEHRNRICNCECGSKFTHCNTLQHLKSIKHCKFIESQTIKPEVYEV